jgi:putative ABC transport system permease protein
VKRQAKNYFEEEVMQTLWQDLRYGARMLLKQPGFTLIAILTLALGIGANTVIFSIINPTLLHTLPYLEPERLVTLPHGPLSLEAFLQWQAQSQAYTDLAAFDSREFNFIWDGQPELAVGVYASAGYLRALSIGTVLGRTFLPEEHQPGNDRAVLIGAELWLPLTFAPPNNPQDSNGRHWVSPLARLKPGVTLAAAQAELSVLARQLKAAQPERYSPHWNPQLSRLSEEVVRHYRTSLLLLLCAVGFVLLIACANVAGLLLARGVARQKEVAVRAALGAGRLRLIRQFLTEGLLLSLAGGLFGVVLALWGLSLFKAFIPADIPRVESVSIDVTALGATLLLALLSGLFFSLAPALLASRPDLNRTLKEGSRNATAGGSAERLLRWLVVAECALSLVLMIGATLMLRSFLALQRVDPGFEPEQALTLKVGLAADKFSRLEQVGAFQQQMIERLQTLPGVEAAATVYPLPLGRETAGRGLEIEGHLGASGGADWSVVSPAYFRALGIPLRRGRYFNERDTAGSADVAIIDEAMAARYWPNDCARQLCPPGAPAVGRGDFRGDGVCRQPAHT